jgi:hypothetical protein
MHVKFYDKFETIDCNRDVPLGLTQRCDKSTQNVGVKDILHFIPFTEYPEFLVTTRAH